MVQPQNESAYLTPNHFELKYRDTTIIYDATAFDGQPHLSYQGPQGQATRSFVGDQIRAQPHEIGLLITVTLEAIPDEQTTLLTLLLPTIQLVGATEQAFETVGIITTQRDSIAGPGLVSGALQSYQVLPLKGEAHFVVS